MAPKKQSHLLEDYHLLSYDVIDSTNEEAKRLAQGGGSHGAVIWAKRQTAGRGRMGREWVSAEGNFYVSILLAPEKPLQDCAQLSFVTALAAIDTLDGIVETPKAIACKWPNDVLLHGKKLGGILLESFTTEEADGTDKRWVVVGVGLNIDSYPEHVMYPAISLRQAGVEIISAKIVLSRFVEHFVTRYDEWANSGFKAVQKEWLKRAYRLGEPIEVAIGDTLVSGVFDTIDADGRLCVKQADGSRATVDAGDVFFRQLADAASH
jgi:BirA family biotin operon repressor/biotin-[acetyl-CoA-carboxylase] ligase